MNTINIKDFLTISYDELEDRNLEIKRFREEKRPIDFFKSKTIKYLSDEKRIKAISILFTDLEGKLLCLDYDKNYILNGGSLTFDGSSIRGFSSQNNSDLALDIDWSSFRFVPSDIFGPGKVLMFANVIDQSKTQYNCDFRGILDLYTTEQFDSNGYLFNIAPEIEGFLLKGVDVEQNYNSIDGFTPVTYGGYYNSLPQDTLRIFIDEVAEIKRALGFENEKDHPEVAPSQFELNYKYTDPVQSADQIQLYKLVCRQVAKKMGCTASFLPKPIANVNGSGMHINISITKNNSNIFYDNGQLSDFADKFAVSLLYHGKQLCLVFNPSVNAYRRLDPKFEAPNDIKMSSSDRGSMIRIPFSGEKGTRIEIRSVAPDCNPYMSIYAILTTGLLGTNAAEAERFKIITTKREKLPSNIYDAIRYFKSNTIKDTFMSDEVIEKYASLKESAAHRSPKELGSKVKTSEIIYHHEITNQSIWGRF